MRAMAASTSSGALTSRAARRRVSPTASSRPRAPSVKASTMTCTVAVRATPGPANTGEHGTPGAPAGAALRGEARGVRQACVDGGRGEDVVDRERRAADQAGGVALGGGQELQV